MSEINTNNLIDVDDASIKENTPMMLIEQGGKTIAVPIPAYISGGGTSDETIVRDKYYECLSVDVDIWTGVEYSQLVAPYGIAITINGATDLYLEKEVNGERVYEVLYVDGDSTGQRIAFNGERWVWYTGLGYFVDLDITNEDATTEEIAEAVNKARNPSGTAHTAEAAFYAVWVKDNDDEYKILDNLSKERLLVGSVYRGDGLLEVKEFRSGIGLTSDALKRINYEYRERLMTPVEDVLIVSNAGNANGVYCYESDRHWTMTAADGTKYSITAGIGDCMLTDLTNSKQLYYSVYKPDYSYPETARDLVEAIDGVWWNEGASASTDIGLAAKTMAHLGDGKVVELVSEFNGDI